MGRKKPLSTAELVARTSQDKKKPSKVEQPDSWENDAAAIAAEQEAAQLASPEEQQQADARAERAASQKKRTDAETTAKRDAARAQSEQAAAVTEAMARKKGKGRGKAAATTATASAAPSGQASTRRKTEAAPPAAQQRRRAPPEAPPLLSEVPCARRNLQAPEEWAEEWEAARGGGFVRLRFGYHPGVSCDATGQHPLIGRRHRLLADHCDDAAHPHGYDVCASAFAALGAAERERFELIEPPCRAPLAYLVGSAEHLTLASLGLVVVC